ncbi:NusA-like transcription termination signal-binding factor [archaeon]|nr:NusA-like transcription termination signal-binding factor [archaeon]
MKLDFEQIRLINALDEIANVSAKDCFIEEDNVVFLVHEKHMRKAIGKNGATVQLMQKKIGKTIELFEYNEKPEKFFAKAFYKAKVEKVVIKKTNGKKIALIKTKNNDKGAILHNLKRLGKIKELARRNYEIEEVRIR